MQIKYLDGVRLKRALIAGGRRVHKYRDQLNTINVFPVADSDTGTNMSGTMKAMISGIIGSSERNISVVSKIAADSALTGARGNSGTILSQFFYGVAEGIEGRTRINTRTFSRIVRRAVDHTYNAISEPVEGTILTVLKEWSEKMVDVSRVTGDFATLFSDSLTSAKESLRETRKRLPSLRKAKVVDAGALGLVHLIEGIVSFIERGKIREVEDISDIDIGEEPLLTEMNEEINFRYCTECLVEGCEINHTELRLHLASLGDSLIVAGSPSRTKIHIHTDDPEEVFRIVEEYGVLSDQKADDMHKQYAVAHTPHSETALVLDSACDIPADILERDYVHMVPVKVLFGEKSYIDKIALTPEHYYDLLRTMTDRPATTSQPAPRDFEKVFSFLTGHYRNVVYLGLAGALSGTIESARSALEQVKNRDSVHIFDSRSVTIGAGLIARRVAEEIEKETPYEEIIAMMNRLIERVRILITIPSLEALIRSGRLSRTRGLIAQLLKLRPLLTIDSQGRIVKAAMVRGVETGRKKIVQILRSRLGEGTTTDFAIAHVDSLETAEWFKDRIGYYFQSERDIFILDASPALATHTGFGTVAVAYFEPSMDVAG